MRINLNFTPAGFDACQECGAEQNIRDEFGKTSCRACDYDHGGELAEQWSDYCTTLDCEPANLPTCLSIDFCHQAEGGNDYYIEVSAAYTRNPAEHEAEIRAFIARVGKSEECDIQSILAGCANAMNEATEDDLNEIITACADSDDDSIRTREAAEAGLLALAAGKPVWTGQDDDGYYVRVAA
jgi:hypothetical protein